MLNMLLNLSTGPTLEKTVQAVNTMSDIYEKEKQQRGYPSFFFYCVCPNSITAPPGPLLKACVTTLLIIAGKTAPTDVGQVRELG